MADRRRQIIQLLGSRFDGLYLPAGGLRTASGFAPGVVEACTDCGGRGRVLDRFRRWVDCSRCGGKGRLAFDRMDSLRVAVGSRGTVASARPRRTVRCDRCGGDGVWKLERCDLCGGQGRRDEHVFELHLGDMERDATPLETAIEERAESGSYRELDEALRGVVHHVNKPWRYQPLTDQAAWALRLLDEVFLPPVDRTYEELRNLERTLVELALGYIDWRMPSLIRVPVWVGLNDKERRAHWKRVRGRRCSPAALTSRDVEIRRWAKAGRPVQWLAGEYGLSVSQINRIVRGESSAA